MMIKGGIKMKRKRGGWRERGGEGEKKNDGRNNGLKKNHYAEAPIQISP